MGVKELLSKGQVCGVDLSQDKPICVLVHRSGSKTVYISAPEIPGSSNVACALPPRLSLIRRLESPFSSERKTKRVLLSLMDIHMPFSVEECVVTFGKPLKGQGVGMSALAAAARREDVETFLAEAAKTGLNPNYLFAEGIALWNGSGRAVPFSEDASAVLKIESSGATLCLGKNGELLASHSLSSMERGHIKRLLVSCFGGPSKLVWRLAGSNAADNGVRRLIDELGEEWVRDVMTHENPKEFLARSLADEAMGSGGEQLNMRMDSLEDPSVSQLKSSRLRLVGSTLIVFGVLMASASLSFKLLLGRLEARTDKSFLSIARELAGGDLGGASGIHALQRAESAVQKELADFSAILAPFQPSPFELLRNIAVEAGNSDVLLEMVRLESQGLRIEGTAPSWNAPESVSQILKARGYSVAMDRQESLADESIRFVIKAEGMIN